MTTERSGKIRGPVFVLGDNIDTDQIIPAHYLTLVPTIPEEYEKLGSYAFAGLPEGNQPFVPEGGMKTRYPIVIAGRNFGCGSSREHAPIAIGAAGGSAVVAESYARIFFRNCVATGELYPVETAKRLVGLPGEAGHRVAAELPVLVRDRRDEVQILGWDDLVGVDVLADDVDPAADGTHCKSSRGSVMRPVMADAATVYGDAR